MTKISRTILAIGMLVNGVSLTLAVAISKEVPPVARTVSVVDERFGVRLPDAYRWMESGDKGEFEQWLSRQSDFARANLKSLPLRAMWANRLESAGRGTRITRFQRPAGGKIFFLRFDAGEEGVLLFRESNGVERQLLSPKDLASDAGQASISEFSPSPDGGLVAVNIDRDGREVSTLKVLDVKTGHFTGDSIERVWGHFAAYWLNESSGFTYTQMAPVPKEGQYDPLQNMRVRVHRIGADAAKDPIILGREIDVQISLAPEELPFISLADASPWGTATVGTSRPERRVCVAPKQAALSSTASWKCIIDYEDGVQGSVLHGSELYVVSTKGAPNGRVLDIDLTNATRHLSSARVVLPNSANSVLTGLVAAHDAIYVRKMTRGVDSIVRVPFDNGRPTTLHTPISGSAYLLSADPSGDGVIFTIQGWTRPRVAYRFDPTTKKLVDLALGDTASNDYHEVVSLETEALSKDGTRVPLTMLQRVDTTLDGRRRVILEGYGAYGTSERPIFDPLTLEWVKAGNVYAIAHVRGGGENGDAWRLAGKGRMKYKGVEDFLACAEEIVKRGWTKPERLAAWGTSAGGILVGGAMVRKPEQFGAVILEAAAMNPVRLEASPNGASQFAEFGDPRTPQGLKALLGMDPYMNIRDGVKYPAVLLLVALNDGRLAPWQSGKFAARLAAASSSGKPVWLRTDAESGHIATSLDAQAHDVADAYAFLETNLH